MLSVSKRWPQAQSGWSTRRCASFKIERAIIVLLISVTYYNSRSFHQPRRECIAGTSMSASARVMGAAVTIAVLIRALIGLNSYSGELIKFPSRAQSIPSCVRRSIFSNSQGWACRRRTETMKRSGTGWR